MKIPVRISILLFFVASLASHKLYSQAGPVYTVAGGGTATGEGIPATSASFSDITGLAIDQYGNTYIADRLAGKVICMNAVTKNIHTVAGNGSMGYGGDGGPATAAMLGYGVRGLAVSHTGDLFISDDVHIRKVDLGSGIITTVAGGGTSLADGIPATDAVIGVNDLCVDFNGNLYFGSDNRIRRVDAVTGIITTVAGTGTPGDAGDGGPATAAQVGGSTRCISIDNKGNLYLLSSVGNRIRKIDATTGLIHTIAGGGTSAFYEGIPATSFNLYSVQSFDTDGDGNLFIGDWGNDRILHVDVSSGATYTLAGSSASTASPADGTPALSALVHPFLVAANSGTGKISYCEAGVKVRDFFLPSLVPSTGIHYSAATDSFLVYVDGNCAGPRICTRTLSWHPGLSIATSFGDGTYDTSIVGLSWYTTGYIVQEHSYASGGSYQILQVLLSSGVAVDTLDYEYTHLQCVDMSVNFFKDLDFDGVKGPTESYLYNSLVTEIDSNDVPVDTVVASSGFSYRAHGLPGDVYRFRVIDVPPAIYASMPASGVALDTIQVATTTNPTKWIGFDCAGTTDYDIMSVLTVSMTRPHRQHGKIYVKNNYCFPSDVTVGLHFNPHYFFLSSSMTPLAISTETVTWNLPAMSSADNNMRAIPFSLQHITSPPFLADGDTVGLQVYAGPVTGDINPMNNIIIRTDTIRVSHDPNAISVQPGCFDNDTEFTFLVQFENIGSGPAEHVHVMDTLSPLLDAGSIRIIASSHTMFTQKTELGGRTIYKFDFPNIHLADSSDHEGRNGMFVYAIKNKPGMPVGSVIKSRVGIYFDQNDVVMTNEARNQKGCPVETNVKQVAGNAAGEVNVFPNPTENELRVSFEKEGSFSEYSVYDMHGRLITHAAFHTKMVTLSTRTFAPGMYYIVLRGSSGVVTKKFVRL